MTAKLGSLAWLERTGGRLAWHDELAMIAQGAYARLAKRRSSALPRVELDDLLPPDSAIANEATALARAASEPYLFNHCLRAYFLARLLDDRRTPYDGEALYVALMLHDMGLTDAHRLSGADEQCFTIVGARMANELATQHGWSERRAELAANAIALHLNVVVDHEHGREAQLVRAGSGADVAGLGVRVLPRDQIDELVARYPRHELKKNILATLKTEAVERPCCRIAFLQRRLGFRDLVRRAPFPE